MIETATDMKKYFNSGWIVLATITAFAIASCKKEQEKKPEVDPLAIYYKVKTTWPHDVDAYTQGLEIHDGKLFESTGQNGKSWIGIVDVATGKPDKKVQLDEQYFGEGITIMNNKVYQLTYKTKVGFVYDLKSWNKLREFQQPLVEGWGLTHDSVNLIMSEGSNKLYFVDTTSLQPVRVVSVTDEKGPVSRLNELEYVNGFVYANIYETNMIVKINPASGKVVGRLDLSALSENAAFRHSESEVLN